MFGQTDSISFALRLRMKYFPLFERHLLTLFLVRLQEVYHHLAEKLNKSEEDPEQMKE